MLKGWSNHVQEPTLMVTLAPWRDLAPGWIRG